MIDAQTIAAPHVGPDPVADPTATLLAQVVAPQVAALANAALTGAVGGLQADAAAFQGQLLDLFNAHKAEIEQKVATAGQAVFHEIVADPATDRWLALEVVGAVLVGCLIVLVAYLLGNSAAAKVVAGVPVAVLGLVTLLARLPGTAKH